VLIVSFAHFDEIFILCCESGNEDEMDGNKPQTNIVMKENETQTFDYMPSFEEEKHLPQTENSAPPLKQFAI
jgi:hypothetical protein